MELMLLYTEHRNPKVRGVAGTCCAAACPRLAEDEWSSLGFGPLLKAAGRGARQACPGAEQVSCWRPTQRTCGPASRKIVVHMLCCRPLLQAA